MKNNNTLRSNLRNFVLIAAAFLSLQSFAAPAQEPADAPRLTVQKTQPIDGQPVFQVSVEKPGTEAYELHIVDEDGTVLYTETIRTASYSKRFQLDEAVNASLRVEIKPVQRNGKPVQAYYISSQSQVVTELVVTKL